VLLLTLTVVTGTVDAVSILSLGRVFVANMTGNVVFVGFRPQTGRVAGLNHPPPGHERTPRQTAHDKVRCPKGCFQPP
jgi:hypothetical protein